jgi:hypothetical protein
MTISDVASGLILQAAGFAAAQILELEEEEAKNASSLAGRTAVPRLRRSVRDIYMSLGDLHFRRAYHMPYAKFRQLHAVLASGGGAIQGCYLTRYVPLLHS